MCVCVRVYHCAQLSYTTQQRTVLIIFHPNLQKTTTALNPLMLSFGGEGNAFRFGRIELVYLLLPVHTTDDKPAPVNAEPLREHSPVVATRVRRVKNVAQLPLHVTRQPAGHNSFSFARWQHHIMQTLYSCLFSRKSQLSPSNAGLGDSVRYTLSAV